MFDGVPAEQLHQFIAASRASLPLPLPNIPLSSFSNLQPFDHHHPHHNYTILHHPQPQPQPQELAHLPPQQPPPPHGHQILQPPVLLHRREDDQDNKQQQHELSSLPNMEVERQRSTIPESSPSDNPWSNDELLALLRIRSTMENWFPEFTWEHVSRKLAEVGFKRSAEKCKEKFEEESRYFNNINFNKNFRFISELEQLYQPPPASENPPPTQTPDAAAADDDQPEKNNSTQKVVVVAAEVEKPSEKEEEEVGNHQDSQGSPSNDQTVSENKEEAEEVTRVAKSNNRKRKRERRFEMLKGFCKDIVNKLMAQQEDIHSKLLEDMAKRDEEKLAREEAWKKQEMERMNKELETMAQEQAVAGDRQATIIKFLKKFTSSTSSSTNPSTTLTGHHANAQKESSDQEPITTTTTTTFQAQNNPSTPTSVTEAIAPQSPSSSTLSIKRKALNPSSGSDHHKTENPSANVDKAFQDLRKRWPRDEVLALINLRCSLFNNNGEQQEKENKEVKAPLWERISQGMLELGYKRNAKRCKEKWENINKYFRKTKDVNKKRSVDSRTCPYFHQLSTLYNQGVLVPPSDHQAALPPPENPSPEKQSPSPTADEGEKKNSSEVQQQAGPAAFEFEF